MKLTIDQLKDLGYRQKANGEWTKFPTRFDSDDTPEKLEPLTPKKRIRQSTKPLLNKLETEWYEVLKREFDPTWICPQSIRLKLGNGIWYKPDFFIWTGTPWAYEVKGPFAHRGGFENLKVAAHAYPLIKFRLVWKENGQWKEQQILP